MKRLLIVLLCLSGVSFGQGSRIDSNVMTSSKDVPYGAQAPIYTVPFSTVTICSFPNNGEPCTNTVPIYQDQSLTVPQDNPIEADVQGRFGFWAPAGQYTYSIVSPNGGYIGTYILSVSGSTGGNISPASIPHPCTYYLTPGSTVSPNPQCKVDALGNLTTPSVNGYFSPVGLVADGVVCGSKVGTCTYSGTDNTLAIQTAINSACAAGGGQVNIPGGTYNISNVAGAPRQTGSVTTHVAALTIPCSNVTLSGAGQGATTLSFWVVTGSNVHNRPSDICPVNPDFTPTALPPGAYSFPRTWRGSIIYVVGSGDVANPRTGITIQHLSLEGNATISRNSFNPVRWDGTLPLPPYSQCLAWDTSFKGVYFQNNNFNLQPTDGAYYRPTANYTDHVMITDVGFRDILGEMIYAGEPIYDLWVTNSNFANTNGDFISVAGGHTLLNNVGDNCAGNGFENPVTKYPVTDRGNHISNCLSGINEINFDYINENPTFPPVTIENNVLENILRNGLFMFDPYNYTVKSNTLIDCAWRGDDLDSASCINLYANLPPNPVQWGPAGPSVTNGSTASSGGSFPAGTYSIAATWAVTRKGVNGQTSSVVIDGGGNVSSACLALTVAANGTVTINKPSQTPPDGTTGWYPYMLAGATCDSTHTPNIQIASSPNGYPPIPLTTASVTLLNYIPAGPNSPSMAWPNPGNSANGYAVYPSNPTNTKVMLNTITSKKASISTGIGGWGAPSAFQPIWAQNVTIAYNTPSHLLDYAKSPHAAPGGCPTLTPATAPPYTYAPEPLIAAGTYYFKYTELWPEGETPASPECSITIGSGQQINITPPVNNGAPFFKVYASDTAGQEIIQDNHGNSITASYNTFTQQYTLRTAADGGGYVPPPTQAVLGTTFKAGTGFPTAMSVVKNSAHAINTTIHDNDSVGTLSGAVQDQASIGQLLTTTADTTIAQFTPNTEGNVQISFMYKVANAPTTINARVTYRAPDGSFPTYALTASELSVTPQSVNGAWYLVTVPDITITTGFPVSIIVTAGTANNITVHGSISSKGMIQ